MKVSGHFIAILSTRQENEAHPEGEWVITQEERVLACNNVVDLGVHHWSHVTLDFRSHTGGTGGVISGVLISDNVIKGHGEVWGSIESGWRHGWQWAPYTANVELHPCGGQEYIGSLLGCYGCHPKVALEAFNRVTGYEAPVEPVHLYPTQLSVAFGDWEAS